MVSVTKEADGTNWEFVRAFDSFETYQAAATFLRDWIKLKKHKLQSVCRDLPVVFDRIVD